MSDQAQFLLPYYKNNMKYFIVILVSYLLGSIPFGLIINKLFFKEKDLRQAGSKILEL